MPKRIQRKRRKGWRMPPNTIYVGRPSIWGNPFKVTKYCSQVEAVERFRWLSKVTSPPKLNEYLNPLRGKDLACWCRLDQPCHADVLLAMANEESLGG